MYIHCRGGAKQNFITFCAIGLDQSRKTV